MKEIDKIVGLLEHEALERKVAAAIVLGELGAKGPEVVGGLGKLLGSGVSVLQRHALDALARIGAKKSLPAIFPLLTSSAAEVREAASRAVASVGEDALPIVKERMATATPEERRALDGVLAEIGGKDAFGALLKGLASSDADAAKAAALAVRAHVKGAETREKKTYATATLKFLETLEKKDPPSPSAVAATLKLLGFLEDKRAVPVLADRGRDPAVPDAVRMEAILALRFCMKEPTPEAVEALAIAANAGDRTLSQAALHTLGSLTLAGEAVKKIGPLASHPDADRAIFAIELVARQKGPEATHILVRALSARDKRVAEAAAKGLGGREDATTALAKALLEAESADRAWAIRTVLRPQAKRISAALKKQIVETALSRVKELDRGFEAHLDIAREADPDTIAEGLRDIAQKAKKGGKDPEKAHAVLSILCKSDKSTDEDRFALAVLDLHKSAKDTAASARAADEALLRFGKLLEGGFDVLSALKKDKSLELDELYYLGFHFSERRQPIGEEILGVVVERGGRTKVGKMAKNKLKLAGPA
ncbi:MAG: HEAT repeat domain-containing protein [Myxococcales bacterium]|nr:HEAT repeat domain-containing protein [Myxococcales bacterium]